MKNVIFLLLCLFVQNFYCAQPADLVSLYSLGDLCTNKLLALMNDPELASSLILELQKTTGEYEQFIRKAVLQNVDYQVIKKYMSYYPNAFNAAVQICVLLPSGIENDHSEMSSDNKYAILYSKDDSYKCSPYKLVVLSTGLVVDMNDLNFRYETYDNVHGNFIKKIIETHDNTCHDMSVRSRKVNIFDHVFQNHFFRLGFWFGVHDKQCSLSKPSESEKFHYFNLHPSYIEYLNLSNDNQYFITGSKSQYIITYIGKDLLKQLNPIKFLFIRSLSEKHYFSNAGKTIILDECENIIFNSLPRFMQYALLSHYKIEYTPMIVR